MKIDDSELAHLVRGANRIGEFFAAMPDAAEARAGIAGHLRRYWAPALRQRLLQHLKETSGEGLDPLVVEALRSLSD
jgi:formate dehydrogenase subunit delta